jgi:hypothetical protein
MKKIMSILMTFAMLFSMCNVVLATETTETKGPTIGTYTGGGSKLASNVLGFVQFVAYGIALGMLMYVGIKYVMASANEKADLKAALVKYVIGAILIASASTIMGWVMSIGG